MTWTPERRQRQAELIREWKPWAKSTGAKTAEGKAVVSRNAYKGGHRTQCRELVRLINVELHQSHELLTSLRQPQNINFEC